MPWFSQGMLLCNFVKMDLNKEKKTETVGSMMTTLVEKVLEKGTLLKVFSCVGDLTKKLQERDLQLFDARSQINKCIRNLQVMVDLPESIQELRDNLILNMS